MNRSGTTKKSSLFRRPASPERSKPETLFGRASWQGITRSATTQRDRRSEGQDIRRIRHWQEGEFIEIAVCV